MRGSDGQIWKRRRIFSRSGRNHQCATSIPWFCCFLSRRRGFARRRRSRRIGRTSCSSFPTTTPTRRSAPTADARASCIETPNIDRLGEGGDACSTAAWSRIRICGPSRAAVLTGQVFAYATASTTTARRRVRRLANDVSQAAASGRISNGHHRQVASGQRSDGLRLLADLAAAKANTTTRR